MRFQFLGPPQKHGVSCACVLCLPWPEQPKQPEAWVPSPRVRRAFSLRGEQPGQPEAWVPSPRVQRAFSLRGPSAHRWSGLRESLDRNRGLFAGWEGVASLGLSLPLSPPPCLLSPAGMGRLFTGVSQSLCFANRRKCVPATLGLPRTGVSVLFPSTLLRLPAALYGVGPALSAVPVFGSSTKARIQLHLRVVSSLA